MQSNLLILEIQLLSVVEKKARKITFHPQTTIILGANQTGKSSLIKSIYRTFGALPKTMHPSWLKADVITLVKFEILGNQYQILRKSDEAYSVFDIEGKLIQNFTEITKGLGLFLAEKFNFKLKLNDRKNNPIIPPPAYFFLPFYIDQDTSWASNWSSFDNLSQLSNWRTAIVEYHSGIRTNDYYDAKSEEDIMKDEYKKSLEEQKLLTNILNNIKNKIPNNLFNIDISVFQQEVEQLLLECTSLHKIQDNYKIELNNLYNQKIHIQSQLNIVAKALNEVKKDYNFAVDELNDEVECPTCGAVYHNSFAERFSIAQDEYRCNELYNELDLELSKLNVSIKQQEAKLYTNNKEVKKIESILQKKQGEIKLKDVIESEGRKEIRVLFAQELELIKTKITEIVMQLHDIAKRLEMLDDKEKKKEIHSFYMNKMRESLLKLDVNGLNESSYKKIDCQIKETGSNKPRALMAYYYTFLNVMQRYGTSTFCPIIIDTPNQQGQDIVNLKKILEFIKAEQPTNSQLILGIEDNVNVDFDCMVIELKDKNSLLKKEEYDEVYKSIIPLLDSTLPKTNIMTLFDEYPEE